MSSPANVRVIGIAGASNGGKTTICNKLKASEGWNETYSIVHMDDYYFPPDDARHRKTDTGTMANFDCIEAVDWDRMLVDIRAELRNAKPGLKCLIIEGIFACTHPEIAQLLDSKIFLKLDYETMKFRRSKREYQVPDEEGYFDKYVYPCYEINLKSLEEQPQQVPVHFIHGSKSKQEVFDQVLQICHESLEEATNNNMATTGGNISQQQKKATAIREVKVETC